MTGEHACDNFGVDAFFLNCGARICSVLFFFPRDTEQSKKDNCPLVEGRNNLLAQSRVRSEGGQPCLNALGTLFGGLVMFSLRPPLTVGGAHLFFVAAWPLMGALSTFVSV